MDPKNHLASPEITLIKHGVPYFSADLPPVDPQFFCASPGSIPGFDGYACSASASSAP